MIDFETFSDPDRPLGTADIEYRRCYFEIKKDNLNDEIKKYIEKNNQSHLRSGDWSVGWEFLTASDYDPTLYNFIDMVNPSITWLNPHKYASPAKWYIFYFSTMCVKWTLNSFQLKYGDIKCITLKASRFEVAHLLGQPRKDRF